MYRELGETCCAPNVAFGNKYIDTHAADSVNMCEERNKWKAERRNDDECSSQRPPRPHETRDSSWTRCACVRGCECVKNPTSYIAIEIRRSSASGDTILR